MQYHSFKEVLLKAKPGARIVYHTGELCIDRKFNRDADACAKLVVALHDLGLAAMYMKREHGAVNYVVVPTRKLRRTESRIGLGDAEKVATL